MGDNVCPLKLSLPPSTCEAGGPRDVQIEVLGGINEHVQVSVWLEEVGRGHQNTRTKEINNFFQRKKTGASVV